MFEIKNLEEDIAPLIEFISKQEETDISYNPQIRGFWLVGEGDTELRVLFSPTGKDIIISRVAFQNKRIGTMQYVLDFLMKYGKQHGYSQITAQSVLSDEMICFCKKNGFVLNQTTAIDEFGDYIKIIQDKE